MTNIVSKDAKEDDMACSLAIERSYNPSRNKSQSWDAAIVVSVNSHSFNTGRHCLDRHRQTGPDMVKSFLPRQHFQAGYGICFNY
ncbi:hypothetical protein N7478_000455 [Penicillium angulare]|uniref:uncharacterized protein n=1 Tax=Penicillium angulare TaxID=116970 RepID=UPI002541C72A|nr:uncharacterized protein N7478_000455 [Penicillium angulare]KAJ5291204.1 hypothetical protein N7478_000455 [Penicillium angulare]